MELRYKPDWEQTKERYRAWWAHEYFGRCALSVTAPRQGAAARPALELLSARGLHIQTWCEGEDEARALLRDAEAWSVDRG